MRCVRATRVTRRRRVARSGARRVCFRGARGSASSSLRRAQHRPKPAQRVLTRAQARVLWDDIVASSRAGHDLLSPSSAARLAARSWRRLHDYLIPIEQLAAFDAPEPAALLEWCSEFARRCRALEAIDEAELAQWAFDTGFTPRERIALAGFDLTPPAMTRLIARWREQRLIAEGGSASAPRTQRCRRSRERSELPSSNSRHGGRARRWRQDAARSASF